MINQMIPSSRNAGGGLPQRKRADDAVKLKWRQAPGEADNERKASSAEGTLLLRATDAERAIHDVCDRYGDGSTPVAGTAAVTVIESHSYSHTRSAPPDSHQSGDPWLPTTTGSGAQLPAGPCPPYEVVDANPPALWDDGVQFAQQGHNGALRGSL